jgi:hypothetical protein
LATRGEPSAPTRLNFLAIGIGLAVDIVGTSIASVLLFAAAGIDPGDAAAVERLRDSTQWLLAGLPVGLLFTRLGGYVAAALAPGAELNHAFLVGIASAITGALSSLAAPPPPLWFLIVALVLTVPAGMAGGYIRARMRR